MDIIFYNNLSDPDTIGKTLTEGSTISGYLKNDCDVMNPRIVISNNGMVNANYCYIADFGRYYFIDKQVLLSNNTVALELSVDVLESFKSSILALSCIIDNSTTNNDKYLNGREWVSTVKSSTFIKNFPYGLNSEGEYILITAGG